MTRAQQGFLECLQEANFDPKVAYLLSSNCKTSTAKVEASKILRLQHVRTAIISLIENSIYNLQPLQKSAANALHGKLLALELREQD